MSAESKKAERRKNKVLKTIALFSESKTGCISQATLTGVTKIPFAEVAAIAVELHKDGLITIQLLSGGSVIYKSAILKSQPAAPSALPVKGNEISDLDRDRALSNPNWAAEYAHLCAEHGADVGDRYLRVCLYPAKDGHINNRSRLKSAAHPDAFSSAHQALRDRLFGEVQR